MADEATKPGSDSTSSEETEAAPKGSLKKLIVIGVAVLLLGGGGVAGWKVFLAKTPAEGDEAAATAGKPSQVDKKAKPKIMHELKPFIVNLQGQRLLYNTKADVLNPHFLVYGDESGRWTDYL